MPDKATRSSRRQELDSQASLLTIFLLSPTVGTFVAAWRGIQRLRAGWAERHALEHRAVAVRARAYAHVLPRCAACGFGTLRVVGDGPLRLQALPAYAHARHKHSPRDLRCDRPGCHHIVPHGMRGADKMLPVAA